MSTFCWYVAACYSIAAVALVAVIVLQFFRSER